MPECPIRANSKDFESSIGILPHARYHENVCIGGLCQWIPVTPRLIRNGLPDVPECSVGANGKDFETPIGVLCNGEAQFDTCSGLPNRPPTALSPRAPSPFFFPCTPR